MNLDNFAAQIGTNDFARPNLFRVNLERPGDQHQAAQFFVKAASIPSSTVGVVEVPFLNRKLKVPGDRTFQDWTVTVINDEAQVVRQQLVKWQQEIQGYGGAAGMLHPIGAHARLSVQTLSRDLQYATHQVDLECWPSEIGAVELGWETADAVQEYTVTFSVTSSTPG